MHNLIKTLEEELERHIIVIATATRTDITVDLDLQAARLFRTLLDRTSQNTERRYAVLLYGGGGHIGFADSIRRTLSDFDAIIGDRISGVLSMIALAANARFLTSIDAIGAYDHGPFWPEAPEVNGHIYDDIPALGGLDTSHDPMMPGRVAHLKNFQRRAKIWLEANAIAFDHSRLSAFELGLDTGLSVKQLEELSLPVQSIRSSTHRKLLDYLDNELGNVASPIQRYTELDLADEVEYEFATEVPGAILANRDIKLTYQLDTGKPDPDTGRLLGGWEKSRF